MNLCADTDDTVLVKVLGSVITDIGNIAGEFLIATLGLTDIERELLNMDRSEDILTHHALGDNHSILEVVALPRHEGDHHIAAQSEFTTLSGITLTKHLSLLNLIAFLDNWAQVDGGRMIGTLILGKAVFLHIVVERNEALLLSAVVTDDYLSGVDILDNTVGLGVEQHTTIVCHSLLNTRTHNGNFGIEQGNSLTHHVRSHKGTVGIVVLEERNERSCNRGNLIGCNINEVYLLRRHNWEVCLTAGLHTCHSNMTGFILRSGSLSHGLVLFSLSRKINGRLVEHHLTIVYTLVRSLYETELVYLCIDAKRRNQTDIRTFRGLDGTEAAVVGIVDVSDLEACTLTRQTARTQSRDTTLMGQLGQWVGLIHELAQLIGAKERVDNRRKSLGIDKLSGGEHFVITHIHALTDSARHTCKTNTELIGELLSDSADATVRQVVDIVNLGLLVDKFNQILDNGSDILFSQHTDVVGNIEVELGIDSIASNITKVITLLREEEFLNNAAGGLLVWRLGIAELTIDILAGLFGVVGSIFLESIVDDRVVDAIFVLRFDKD